MPGVKKIVVTLALVGLGMALWNRLAKANSAISTVING